MRKSVKLSWRPLSVMACALLPLAMCGCATSSYMGIGLAPGSADPALQQLAQRARLGDKQAQFGLAKLLLQVDTIADSDQRACKLLRMAASDTPERLFVYMPSPGGGAKASVLSVQNKAQASGLVAARDLVDRCKS